MTSLGWVAHREEGGSNSSISRYAPHKECERHKKIHCGKIFNPTTDSVLLFTDGEKNKEQQHATELDQYDLTAAEEETAYHCSQEMVLRECQLVDPNI